MVVFDWKWPKNKKKIGPFKNDFFCSNYNASKPKSLPSHNYTKKHDGWPYQAALRTCPWGRPWSSAACGQIRRSSLDVARSQRGRAGHWKAPLRLFLDLDRIKVPPISEEVEVRGLKGRHLEIETRLVKILQLWQTFQNVWQQFEGLLAVGIFLDLLLAKKSTLC